MLPDTLLKLAKLLEEGELSPQNMKYWAMTLREWVVVLHREVDLRLKDVEFLKYAPKFDPGT